MASRVATFRIWLMAAALGHQTRKFNEHGLMAVALEHHAWCHLMALQFEQFSKV